jgi:hypothetical protein
MKKIIGLALLFTVTGCFHIHYITNEPVAPSPADESWHHNFIYGLVEGSPPVPVSQICPDGYAKVESETSFVNGLVRVLTFSIYTPETVTVSCKAGSPAPASATRPWK